MNLYFTLFLAPIWPNSFHVCTFYCVKEGSNRPPSAYFCVCSIFRYFQELDRRKGKM